MDKLPVLIVAVPEADKDVAARGAYRSLLEALSCAVRKLTCDVVLEGTHFIIGKFSNDLGSDNSDKFFIRSL